MKPWTDQDDRQLVEYRKLKLSYEAIARVMQRTKTAIASRAQRLNLLTHRMKFKGDNTVKFTRPDEVYQWFGPHPYLMTELTKDQCRFPLECRQSKQPTMWFCGGQKDGEGPYCEAHKRICYQPLQKR